MVGDVDLINDHNGNPTTREANENSSQCLGHFHLQHVHISLAFIRLWEHRVSHREIDSTVQARHDDKRRRDEGQSHAQRKDEILLHREGAVGFPRVKLVAFARVKQRGQSWETCQEKYAHRESDRLF